MKRLTFSFSILVLTFIWIYHTAATDYNPAINPVIGDISYVKKFGHLPAPGTDEDTRIKTHLAYAEMLLRKTKTSHLNIETRQKREKLLDHLHTYWLAGVFPKNYDRQDRSPCFIDRDGNICAVGYLVEKSAGRQMAENINKEFQYHTIADMNSRALNEWITENGLTKEEAAIIQPGYGWIPAEPAQNTNYIPTPYAISSSIFGGINLSVNTIQLSNSQSRLVSKIGLVSGVAQIGLGLASLPIEVRTINGQWTSNESKKTLSMINIGLGTGTMLLSTWNLIAHKPVKEKLYSWDICSIPLDEKETAVAFSIKRKF